MCSCLERGIVPVSCKTSNLYRHSVKVSGISADLLTDKYLEAIKAAVHMGNIREVRLGQEQGTWTIALYAIEGECATQIANYLFQVD